jgi:Arc/MetJ-type ribon-helix-helix transcriptional regulator
MKLSVSLPAEDVEFLDSYAHSRSFPSRSAVLQKAVRLLRQRELGPAYEDAFLEWEQSSAGSAWEVTAGDGLSADAPG